MMFNNLLVLCLWSLWDPRDMHRGYAKERPGVLTDMHQGYATERLGPQGYAPGPGPRDLHQGPGPGTKSH